MIFVVHFINDFKINWYTFVTSKKLHWNNIFKNNDKSVIDISSLFLNFYNLKKKLRKQYAWKSNLNLTSLFPHLIWNTFATSKKKLDRNLVLKKNESIFPLSINFYNLKKKSACIRKKENNDQWSQSLTSLLPRSQQFVFPRSFPFTRIK